MNKDLYHLYKDLDSLRKKHLKEVFSSAPKMLRLIGLVESLGKNLTTIKAVNAIYKEDLENHSFQKLTNRFYKLRQELKDWLLAQLKDSPVCFTAEERELSYLRLLIIKNEYSHAFDKLKKLEKRCWDLNIFELLPQVLELCIRCAQATAYTNAKLQKEYVEKYQHAQKLIQLTKDLRMHGFSMVYSDDKEQILQTMRRIIKPHTTFPRFKKTYHYLAFKGSIFLAARQHNGISRHLNAYKKLVEAHPEMPGLHYEKDHIERTAIDFHKDEAVYWASRNNFKKANQQLQQQKEYLEKYSNIYVRVTERELHNSYLIAVNAGALDDAKGYIDQIKEFQQDHGEEDMLYPYFMNELNFYGIGFPKVKCPDSKALLDKVDIYMKSLDDRQKALTQTMKFKFLVALGDWDAAKKMLKSPELINFYAQQMDLDDFHARFEMLVSAISKQKMDDLRSLVELCKKRKKKHQLTMPNHSWFIYCWMEQVSKFYIKKYRYY
ncbi:MAG: hypothetical protein GY810_15710 [Aureispira sp.]|nr:hypothetical protein [Aureispira sp.]